MRIITSSLLCLSFLLAAISPYDDWHRQAWAGALVLILLVCAINIGVRIADPRPVQQTQGVEFLTP